MQWTHYFRNVVQRYQVVITGWPDSVKFTNLSNVSSALPDLKMLERQWVSGATKWVNIDDDEFERLRLERDEQLDNGEIIDHRRRTRSDKGRKRKQPAVSQKGNTNRNKTHKSAEFIESSDDEGEPDKDPAAATTSGPAAQSATAPSADVSGPSTTTHPAGQSNTPDSQFPQFNAHEFAQLNAHEFNAGSSLPAFDPDATLAHLNALFGPDDFIDFSGTV